MNAVFDAIPLGAAFLPLGLYLCALGLVHLRGRPVAIAGVWDGILLGASLLGLVLVGPVALVRPVAGSSAWSWPILLLVFVLGVALSVLVSRPRLVVYNISPEQIRPIVAEVAGGLDREARWAGETVALPTRGFQVHIDGDGVMRSVSLIGVGHRSSHAGWSEFSRRIRQATRRLRVQANPWGWLVAALGAAMVLAAVASAAAAVASVRAAAPAVPQTSPVE